MCLLAPVLESLVGSHVRVSRDGQPAIAGLLTEVHEGDDGPVLTVQVDSKNIDVPWSETTRVKQLGDVT